MSADRERGSGHDSELPVRQIRTANGRDWTVSPFQVPAGFGTRATGGDVATWVLRFECADITLDLPRYPADWATRSDEALIVLLRAATTPAFIPLPRDPGQEKRGRPRVS